MRKTRKEQTYKEPTYTEHVYKEEHDQPIGDEGRKQQERTHTPGNNTDKNGYMAKPGQPRQPKTQENKKEH